MLLLDVKIREELLLLVCAHDNAVDLVIVHVTHLLVLFFLVGFQDQDEFCVSMSRQSYDDKPENPSALPASTILDDLVVDVRLVVHAHVYGLLHALLGDQAQDAHGLGLANMMCTILYLQICMGIPKPKQLVNTSIDKCERLISR